MTSRLFLAVSLPLLLGAADGDWKSFGPKAGGFSISFPAMPAEKKQETKSQAGAVATTYLVLEHEGVTYVASCSVFPKESVKPRTEEKRLDNARDGAVSSAKGSLVAEQKINLAKYPGRELLIRGEKQLVKSRIYAVENRLYQTMVVGSKEQVSGKDGTQFLESFRLK